MYWNNVLNYGTTPQNKYLKYKDKSATVWLLYCTLNPVYSVDLVLKYFNPDKHLDVGQRRPTASAVGNSTAPYRAHQDLYLCVCLIRSALTNNR